MKQTFIIPNRTTEFPAKFAKVAAEWRQHRASRDDARARLRDLEEHALPAALRADRDTLATQLAAGKPAGEPVNEARVLRDIAQTRRELEAWAVAVDRSDNEARAAAIEASPTILATATAAEDRQRTRALAALAELDEALHELRAIDVVRQWVLTGYHSARDSRRHHPEVTKALATLTTVLAPAPADSTDRDLELSETA